MHGSERHFLRSCFRRPRAWGGIRRAVGVAAVLLSAAGGVTAYAQYDVLPGLDYWASSESGTHIDFSVVLIPADFFGPGSDPFDGVVNFVGEPMDGVSTIVERLEIAPLPDPEASSATIDVRLVQLGLWSTEPITITYGGHDPTRFDVYVTLNPVVQSLGHMTIHHTSESGGTYDAVSIYIFAHFDFIPVIGGEPRSWEPFAPYFLEGLGQYGWRHDPFVYPLHPGSGPNFFPTESMPDTGLYEPYPPYPQIGAHWVTPFVSCCFPDDTCQVVTLQECNQAGTMQSETCVGTLQACCMDNGTCLMVDATCCDEAGGMVAGGACTQVEEACCIDDNCYEADPRCCPYIPPYTGYRAGPGTDCEDGDGDSIADDCEPEPEACCLPDDSCIFTRPVDCVAADGTPQGPTTHCAWPQACCMPADGSCGDADPHCCADAGGVPQGFGTTCSGLTVACCMTDGSGDCYDVDPLCCDNMGGNPSPYGAAACVGDGNLNGTDDACEPPLVYKWEQPPDLDPTGIDVFAQGIPDPGVVLADDFLCTMTGPITEIHVWGSWLGDSYPGDSPPDDVDFILSIHADNPAGPAYSTPLNPPLWTRTFVGGDFAEFSVRLHAGSLIEGWYDPATGGYDPQGDHECWEYIFHIPEGDEFIQQGTSEEPTVYWLDVQAFPYDEVFLFGWKTTPLPLQWNDNAVWGSGLDPPPDWWPLTYPAGHGWAGDPLDLAFAILGQQWGSCCLGDLTCVQSTEADCVVNLLGAYQGDGTSCQGMMACCLDDDDICRDIDAICCINELQGTPGADGAPCSGVLGCCREGGLCEDLDVVCCNTFHSTPQGTLCTETTEACCLDAAADPDCVTIDPLCCDDEGGEPSPLGAPWCLGDVNSNGTDDACEAPQACCTADGSCVDLNHTDCVNAGGDPQGPGTDCSITECRPVKWAQPPTFDPHTQYPDCFWGWDEPSVYGHTQIVADDWRCTDDSPITDIHWWGSYRDWDGPEAPPDAPDDFHIGIWTDVPAGVDTPWSHPGNVIWEWTVSRLVLNERDVGCDYHPDEMAVPDTCFRYDFIIPEEDWFYQEGFPTVYWISISAQYPRGKSMGLFQWGWKSREHYYNDDAVRVFDPTSPHIGTSYVLGEPIEDQGGYTWDMAFVLTTAKCPTSNQPDPEDPVVPKNRYISFVPTNPGRMTALRVTLADLPPPFEGDEGCRLWVGEPRLVSESSGDSGPAPSPAFTGAELQTTPHCTHWAAVGLLSVFDDEIVPNARYEVQAIDCECNFGDEASYSASLAVTTSLWGDLVRDHANNPPANCTVCPNGYLDCWYSPDGITDFNDITAVVDKFKNVLGAPRKARADLAPDLPDRVVDFADIPWVVDAFRGLPYPFDEPDECP